VARCVIHEATPMPDERLLDRLRALSTSVVSDAFDRWAGAPGILPATGLREPVVVGPALTVRTRAGDNLVIHKALDIARPGEVVVVAGGGSTDRALLGGLMGHYASTRQIAALVVDGAVRDSSDLDAQAPPTFARGACHLGPFKDGSGELRGAISVAGLIVNDGDIVVGDEDGIAIIPRSQLEEVVVAAEAKECNEREEDTAIARGEWDRSWVDKALDITWL
jgi:regulator of RNase E activity RraA